MNSLNLISIFGQTITNRLLDFVEALEVMDPIDLFFILTGTIFVLSMSVYIALTLLMLALQPVFTVLGLLMSIARLIH